MKQSSVPSSVVSSFYGLKTCRIKQLVREQISHASFCSALSFPFLPIWSYYIFHLWNLDELYSWFRSKFSDKIFACILVLFLLETLPICQSTFDCQESLVVFHPCHTLIAYLWDTSRVDDSTSLKSNRNGRSDLTAISVTQQCLHSGLLQFIIDWQVVDCSTATLHMKLSGWLKIIDTSRWDNFIILTFFPINPICVSAYDVLYIFGLMYFISMWLTILLEKSSSCLERISQCYINGANQASYRMQTNLGCCSVGNDWITAFS